MNNFIQITVLCPPEPRAGAFVFRNCGKGLFHFSDDGDKSFKHLLLIPPGDSTTN